MIEPDGSEKSLERHTLLSVTIISPVGTCVHELLFSRLSSAGTRKLADVHFHLLKAANFPVRGFLHFDPLGGQASPSDRPWFCIAGIWRAHPEVGEAFTMLTMDAGKEVAPYHRRQIIPLARDQWADWPDPTVPAKDVLKYLSKGSLPVTQVFPEPSQEMLV